MAEAVRIASKACFEDDFGMVTLEHFTKAYGRTIAVNDLSMEIRPGEILGFIGRNGAGKSTTIRFLATLIKPTAGTGSIAGYDVVRQPIAARRHLGYMPDMFGDYPGFSVQGFLDFFAKAYGLPEKKANQRVQEVIEKLGLVNYTRRPVRALSRGMKQRLYLARCLLHDPPVLILDEPMNGLDPEARVEFRNLLRQLAASGKTILLSSHILGELRDIATTIAIIHRGHLLTFGEVSQLIKAHTGGLRVLVRFLTPITTFAEAVKALDRRATLLYADSREAILQVQGEEESLTEILRELVMRGISVTAFHSLEPTLEEFFVRLTQDNGQ